MADAAVDAASVSAVMESPPATAAAVGSLGVVECVVDKPYKTAAQTSFLKSNLSVNVVCWMSFSMRSALASTLAAALLVAMYLGGGKRSRISKREGGGGSLGAERLESPP